MKSTLLYLMLAWVSCGSLYAQQKLAEFPVKISKPTGAYLCTDSLGSIGAIIQNNKQYEICILDRDYKIIQTLTYPKFSSDKNQEIIGAILSHEYLTAYFYDYKLKAVSSLMVNRFNNQVLYSKAKVLADNEDFLKGFEMNGLFYLLVVPREKDMLKVMVTEGKDIIEIMNFDIGMSGFYAALLEEKEALWDIKSSPSIHIDEIKYELDNNIRSAHSEKKLYHFDNKLLMTFDEPDRTHLITIDLIQKSIHYKKLNFDLERGNTTREKKGNSFLYYNHLFRSTISKSQLNISILDLDSMYLINSHNFYPEEEIDILNSPILEKEGDASNDYSLDENVLRRTDQFFKSARKGSFAIVANKTSGGHYELQVGSYELYNVSYRNGYRGGPQFSIGMGGFGYPYYGGRYPGYGYPGYYPSQNTNVQRMVYFKSLMDGENLEHLSGNISLNMRDKIEDYQKNVFKRNVPSVRAVISSEKALLLGYYDKGKKFKIIEFRR